MTWASGDALARFEGRSDRLRADLEALVLQESPTDDAPAVSALARWIRDRLASRRGSRRKPSPVRGAATRCSRGSAREEGGALLLGHLDTVWSIGTLKELPYRVEGDRARGPGVFDMKAGIAVAIAALESIAAQGSAASATLLLVPDEETGTTASRHLLLEVARRHRCVYVLEPSLDGAAKTARKGAGLFRLRFQGRAAHAGLEPEAGASALAELARCVLFLESLGMPARETTVTPTVAQSGERTNVVPEVATLVGGRAGLDGRRGAARGGRDPRLPSGGRAGLGARRGRIRPAAHGADGRPHVRSSARRR